MDKTFSFHTGCPGSEPIERLDGSSIRNAKRVLAILTVAAFGPYLDMQFGLGVDHVVIYSLALTAGLKYFVRGQFLLRDHSVAQTTLLLLLSVFWICLITWFSDDERVSNNQVLAEIENDLQPVALLIILSWWLRNLSSAVMTRLLRYTAALICVVLSLHAILQIISLEYDISLWVAPFVRHDTTVPGMEQSLWALALNQGRNNGLFQQPIEAGVAYCVGLIAWMYWVTTSPKRSKGSGICLPLLLIGGVLPVSKVFLIGAPILAALFFSLTGNWRRMLRFTGVVIILLGLLSTMTIVREWKGLHGITEIFTAHETESDPMRVYTAGRFAKEDGWALEVLASHWEHAALTGYGYAAIGCSYDSAYVERFAKGGSVGLAIYAALMILIWRAGIRGLNISRAEGAVVVCFVVLIVGGNLGAPVMTLNRSSIWLWTMLCMSLLIIDRCKGKLASVLRSESQFGALCPHVISDAAGRHAH